MTSQTPSLGNPATTTKLLFAVQAASNGNLADALEMLAHSTAFYAKKAKHALESSKAAKVRDGYTLDGSWKLGRMAGIEIGGAK
jgi:hypothetical protein